MMEAERQVSLVTDDPSAGVEALALLCALLVRSPESAHGWTVYVRFLRTPAWADAARAAPCGVPVPAGPLAVAAGVPSYRAGGDALADAATLAAAALPASRASLVAHAFLQSYARAGPGVPTHAQHAAAYALGSAVARAADRAALDRARRAAEGAVRSGPRECAALAALFLLGAGGAVPPGGPWAGPAPRPARRWHSALATLCARGGPTPPARALVACVADATRTCDVVPHLVCRARRQERDPVAREWLAAAELAARTDRASVFGLMPQVARALAGAVRSPAASAGDRFGVAAALWWAARDTHAAWADADATNRRAAAAPGWTQPPQSRRAHRRAMRDAARLNTSLFLAATLVLDAALPAAPAADEAALALDTLSRLEFCRVEFSGYKRLMTRLLGGDSDDGGADMEGEIEAERTRRDAASGASGGAWSLRAAAAWLFGGATARPAAAPAAAAAKPPSRDARVAAAVFARHWVRPSPGAAAALAASPPPRGLANGGLVGVARDYFLLGLAQHWLAVRAAPEAAVAAVILPTCVRYAGGAVPGVGRRALESLAALVDAAHGGETGRAVAHAMPYALRQAADGCPARVRPAWLARVVLAMFRAMPRGHPLPLYALRAVAERAAVLAAGDDADGAAAVTALFAQLAQFLPAEQMRAALRMASDAVRAPGTSAAARTAMLTAVRAVVEGNYDLYQRDRVVRWVLREGAIKQ